MSKKKKLTEINKTASENILEIRAILEALSRLEESRYPANALIDMANEKLTSVFINIENNREILKIAD